MVALLLFLKNPKVFFFLLSVGICRLKRNQEGLNRRKNAQNEDALERQQHQSHIKNRYIVFVCKHVRFW